MKRAFNSTSKSFCLCHFEPCEKSLRVSAHNLFPILITNKMKNLLCLDSSYVPYSYSQLTIAIPINRFLNYLLFRCFSTSLFLFYNPNRKPDISFSASVNSLKKRLKSNLCEANVLFDFLFKKWIDRWKNTVLIFCNFCIKAKVEHN